MATEHRLFPLSALTPTQRATLDALAAREGQSVDDYTVEYLSDGRLVTYSDDEGEVPLGD